MLVLRPLPTDLRAGITRRAWLQLGLGGALASASLTGQASAETQTPATMLPGFGKAKSCIIVYLFGGPSHIDIWDMKPGAPDGIRGEFKPIDTSVPGVQFCEHIPRLARLANEL